MTIQIAPTTVNGACPHDCPDTCGIVTVVQDGKAVKFYGDPNHPVTQGWLCSKVRPYLDHVYHPDRLTQPLRRAGPKGSGQWQPIGWDEAIDTIATRWQRIMAQHGAEAILPYSYSGTLGLVQMSVCNTRLWNRLGASQLDRAICGEAAGMAVRHTLGERLSPPYASVLASKLVIIWGHNPVSTAPHFMPWLNKARRNGTRVVVIDPRRTRTARQADWHIQPTPGSDGALALGLAHIIAAQGWHDEDWLNAHTAGWPALRDRLADYPPDRVAAISGVPAADLQQLADEYAHSQPAFIKFADGLQRHRNGGQTVRALLTLPALTGQYGMRGGGIGYSTGGTLKWDTHALNHWDACPPPGRVINMNRLGAALTGEAADPPVMALYVYGSNPAAIAPNAGLIRQGLLRDDLFTVVHEQYLTDTADYADIVLPATTQLEHADLHKGYGHTYLQYNAPAIAPLGDSKSNWDVMRLLAARLGFDEPWLRQDADAVIADMLASTAPNYPALAGVTLAQLKRGAVIPLAPDEFVPFADHHFPTPSGKVELYCQRLADAGIDPLPDYLPADDLDAGDPPPNSNGQAGLRLLTPAAHHFTTSTFANHSAFERSEGEPFVEINPADAAERGIVDGDTVVLENRRGWCPLTAVISDAVQPGVLASPKGRWAKRSGGRNVNWTVSDELGDMAGQSTFHTNVVWLRKATA